VRITMVSSEKRHSPWLIILAVQLFGYGRERTPLRNQDLAESIIVFWDELLAFKRLGTYHFLTKFDSSLSRL
jgi:hypothetical protein